MLNQHQLKKHLPANCLPKELGGELTIDHNKWINHCLEQIKLLHLENNLDNLENLNDLNKSFMFNCDLIGENISNFNMEDIDENDEHFRKNSSELDLSGLSEQLTGLCDKLTNNFEQDLGIKIAQEDEKLVDLNENEKDLNNGLNINGNSNGLEINEKSNDEIVIKPALSNRTSLTIIKPKPENIPIIKLNCDHKLKNNFMKTNSNGFNSFSIEEDDYLRLFKNYLVNNDKSLHLSTDPGLNLNEFIQHLRTKGRKGLFEEYSKLRHMKDLNFIFNNHENLKRFSKLKISLNSFDKAINKEINSNEEINKEKNESLIEQTNNQLSEKINGEKIDLLNEDTNEKLIEKNLENEKEIELDDLDSKLFEKFNDLMCVFSFENALKKNNLTKNRYTDVLCYDHSRVILKEKTEEELEDIIVEEDPINDSPDYINDRSYINANYVDGFEQKNAFISTQGPLHQTCLDFWEMCIQNEVKVIVMTTRAMEGRKLIKF